MTSSHSKASTTIQECLGFCYTPIVAAICPAGTGADDTIAATSAADERGDAADTQRYKRPCSDVQASVRLQTCSTQAKDFVECMGGDEAEECRCIAASSWILGCFDECKETILADLMCAAACDAAAAAEKLTTCAKDDEPFSECLEKGGSDNSVTSHSFYQESAREH